MRTVLAAALLLGVSAVASAEPPRPIVWKNRVIPAPAPTGGPVALTKVSRKLYLNDCMPNGCTVSPGFDDTRTNRSSIPESVVTLSAYPHGTAHWNALVSCVRETFAPFNVEIVLTNPGMESHFEVMIGGSSTQLHPQLQAGGVAPFISCGAKVNNTISFVFPQGIADLEFLCGAVAQEACHVWGLDHELNRDDPMTYLDLGSLKRFQNTASDCGEDLGAERECFCGGTKQNSYQYMADSFGLLNATPAALRITNPTEGKWLKPGFKVNAELDSPYTAVSGTLAVDSMQTASSTTEPYVFDTPAALAAGPHMLTVNAVDAGERMVSASVNVNVLGTCGAGCASGLNCIGGYCVPGADTAGGLGATCTTNEQCITGTCAMDTGGKSLCTGACNAGACPSGYSCLDGANVCWPEDDEGGCNTGGSPGLLLAAFGVIVVLARRRRR